MLLASAGAYVHLFVYPAVRMTQLAAKVMTSNYCYMALLLVSGRNFDSTSFTWTFDGLRLVVHMHIYLLLNPNRILFCSFLGVTLTTETTRRLVLATWPALQWELDWTLDLLWILSSISIQRLYYFLCIFWPHFVCIKIMLFVGLFRPPSWPPLSFSAASLSPRSSAQTASSSTSAALSCRASRCWCSSDCSTSSSARPSSSR